MLGEKLKALRFKKELTQKQVSASLNLSEARYNQYETNKRNPDYNTLKDISNYYDVSIDFLINGENIKRDNKIEDEINEKLVLKKALINAGYMKENEDLSDEELKKLMEFVNTNKKFIKGEK